ncbi:hypothetical protein DFH08DRAFT_1071866 [Mycena albidolilacea]|uniref:Uncharacterized protein n=1 Tax=Mycena albidolilacea TaxID=1033008 RepID=A0AAD7ARS4_9AGAR|nr:hypothetical protein DFH08DRAFT_1071866 [Mycena albidolilacea]
MLPQARPARAAPLPNARASYRLLALSGSASFDPSGAVDPDDIAHPVLQQNRVAVVTAVSGIGAAAARAFARLGMKIALASLPASLPALTALAAELAKSPMTSSSTAPKSDVFVVPTDVTVLADVEKLRETVYEAWSEVGMLMNNAGIGSLGALTVGTAWDGLDSWHTVFATNPLGVVNVQTVFVPLHHRVFHDHGLDVFLCAAATRYRDPRTASTRYPYRWRVEVAAISRRRDTHGTEAKGRREARRTRRSMFKRSWPATPESAISAEPVIMDYENLHIIDRLHVGLHPGNTNEGENSKA